MNKRKKFIPVPKNIYKNAGGGTYRCIGNLNEERAVMQNVDSKWTFTAHGCGIYEDGTIDWDRSTGGHFVR